MCLLAPINNTRLTILTLESALRVCPVFSCFFFDVWMKTPGRTPGGIYPRRGSWTSSRRAPTRHTSRDKSDM